jgi:integrase
MTRIEVPYVQEWFDKRAGRIRRRFRRPGYKSIELPGTLCSEDFTRAYQKAMASGAPLAIGATKRSRPGSVSAAIAGYDISQLDFLTLADSTQALRRQLLEKFRADTCGTETPIGERMIADVTPKFLQLYLTSMRPFAARNMQKALRHLMAYATRIGMIKDDPTQFKLPRVKKTGGFHSWEDAEISTFRAKYKVGTMARLAAELALHAGPRCGDISKLGRQHLVHDPDPDGLWTHIIVWRQGKTGGDPLRIPVLKQLQEAIDATPSHGMTFLTNTLDRPFSAKTLSMWFSQAARDAGLRKCTLHGLRKATGRVLAEAGCSASMIQAVLGHANLATAEIYVRAANKGLLAKDAMRQLSKENKAGKK